MGGSEFAFCRHMHLVVCPLIFLFPSSDVRSLSSDSESLCTDSLDSRRNRPCEVLVRANFQKKFFDGESSLAERLAAAFARPKSMEILHRRDHD